MLQLRETRNRLLRRLEHAALLVWEIAGVVAKDISIEPQPEHYHLPGLVVQAAADNVAHTWGLCKRVECCCMSDVTGHRSHDGYMLQKDCSANR